MFKRMLGIVVVAVGVIATLVGCEVSQINWANHFYIVSSACAPAPLTAGATTLHDGVGYIGTPGTLAGTRVTLLNVHDGDFTHDGIQDAAVLLNCHDTLGGDDNGSEIQVFTRDAKPVARLVAPQKYPGGSFPPFFIYNEITVVDNTLYTGVDSYLPADSHAGPSAHDIYRWDWNGSGFTPVNVSTKMTLSGATLTLPAGWVAEAVATSASSHPIMPTWCLMPHSVPAPANPDAPTCTISFSAVPTGTATPELSVDTPGGLVSNPEYCEPLHSQTVGLLGYQDSKLGARPAAYRDWLYSCADGTRWPVEQYVADNAPGYVLYSSHATAPVHAVLTGIAKTAQLPAISAPLRLSDFGVVRTVNTVVGGHQITVDRVVRETNGIINDSPQTYAYNVPNSAVVHGQSLQVGELVELGTNGTTVTHLQVDLT